MDVFSKAVKRAAEERGDSSGDGSQQLILRNRHNDNLRDIQYEQTPVRVLPGVSSVIQDGSDESELSPATHAYNILRARVLQQLQIYNWNLLAITSPFKGNGKTTTAVNLAASIARSLNHTVLLIDLDLGRPSVHRFFGVEPTFGVTDLVNGHAAFQDVAFNPGFPRLTVLPGRERIGHSSEFLSTPRMEQFINEVRSRYQKRVIIFDMPPVLSGADMLSFMPLVQASLLVVEAGKTTKHELRKAVKALEHTRIIGTVLNRGTEIIESYY
ncbi:MAG TPA: exopolysaccharide biosynthesis protein [Chromatiales bacterium]|nr:exopolysaccharide biosynthesis protein [Chromatiales bacterium]